jgi:uncharacterized protein YqgV (UPF0045/DUF77 family)
MDQKFELASIIQAPISTSMNMGDIMSTLKITLYPVDFETPFSLNDCVMSIAILAEQTGLEYRLNSSGAAVEGNKPDLLIFLKRLKNETFGRLTDKVVMIVSYPDEDEAARREHGQAPIRQRSEPLLSRTLEETVLDMIG